MKQQSTSGGGRPAEARTYFDAWGRVNESWKRLPGGVWSKQATGWDLEGRMTDQTVWSSTLGTGTPRTRYSNYDAFGRVGRIESPDPAAQPVRLFYSMENDTTRRVSIAMSRN